MPEPSPSTAAPKKRTSAKARLLDWLQRRQLEFVDEPQAAEIASAFPELSPDSLRHALIDSGLPLAPIVEGVRQDSFEDLERTLHALAFTYENSDPPRRKAIRALVITARRHAELAARNRRLDAARHEQKLEMLLWIQTWLENPPLFDPWLALRRTRINPPPP